MSEIRVDTISEKTSANGVSIDGVLIKDSKIGIGTTSPGAILEVVGPTARPANLAEVDSASTAKFTSDASNADSLYIAEGDSGALIQVNDGATNSSTAKDLQLQPFGGNVGIGTINPVADARLTISSGDNTSNIFLERNGSSQFDVAVVNQGGAFQIKGGSNQSTVADLAEWLKIDGNTGAVTMPLQPAFAAKPASDQTDINCVNANVTVIFGTEIFDVNADFAPSPHGIFTAPVTGKYQLQVNLYLSDFDASADYLQADIVTSNNIYSAIWETTDEDGFATLNIACTADMDANDTASVRLFQGSGAAQVNVLQASRFSGFLAC